MASLGHNESIGDVTLVATTETIMRPYFYVVSWQLIWRSGTYIQWNLYKATTKFCGLLRQVVFQDRENKHDFVKTAKQMMKLVFLVRLSLSHYTDSTVLIEAEWRIYASVI